MKKLLSMLIVVMMIAATFVMAIPAAAVTGTVDEVEALYFDVKPVIDGVVSEEEWGESTVYVDKLDAATIEDTAPVNNRFFMRNTAAVPGFDEANLNMSYEMWLRWDENYYYVAVKVQDPDGHSLKNGRNFTWNGDSFQTRIDPLGYNASSAVGPELYDAELDGNPWSRDDIDDFCFGFVESAGGFSEAWENESNKGITTFLGGACEISVSPAGASYTNDTASGITTYEIAIPWTYIDTYTHEYSQYSNKNTRGAIGREYGMSAVVYNADGNAGQLTWNAGLSWGSGIIRAQQNEYTKTCAGSNKVTLSGDKVSENSAYSAGYEQHPGGYQPPVKTPVYPMAIDTSVLYGPFTYDDESDMDKFGGFIDGERYKDGDNWVVKWDLDTGELQNSPTDSGMNEQNYLATDDEGDARKYSAPGCSYTMEFDLKVTGNETFEEGYFSQVYSWFGGSSTVDYECGYNFDTGKFNITETSSKKVLAEVPGTFTLNEWHHWVFQYFKDNAEMRFYFDPEMDGDHVAASAVPMFKMSYRYFDSPGVKDCLCIFRRLNCQIMMDNVRFYNFVDWTQTGEIIKPIPDPTPTPTPVPIIIDKDVDFDVEQLEDGTFAVTLKNQDAFKESNVTAVTFTVDLTKAEGKLVYKALNDVAEGAVTVTENEDKTVTIKVNDLGIFKVDAGAALMKVILAPAEGATVKTEEVKELISIKASVTTMSSQTGDSAVMYIAAALLLVAILGTGIVLYTRKRRHIDF